jgi:molecular chaperone GrpE
MTEPNEMDKDQQAVQEPSDSLSPEEIEQIQAAVRDGTVEVPSGAEDIIEAFRATLAARDDWHDRFVHLGADYQNFQRRAANNEREARTSATVGVVQNVLPVLDHFDLALEQDPETATADQIMGGVSMIRDELQRVLGTFGVSKIEPEPGDEFDPSKHEAMLQQPTDEVEPGRVVKTLSAGYMLGDRVIRPAKVIIAKGPEEE